MAPATRTLYFEVGDTGPPSPHSGVEHSVETSLTKVGRDLISHPVSPAPRAEPGTQQIPNFPRRNERMKRPPG
jgi:hypothetical protein